MKRPVLILAIFACFVASAAEPRLATETPDSPPPPAVPLFDTGAGRSTLHGTATVYLIGDPSPEEQLYLEMINRARANPTAEGMLLGNTTDPGILTDYQGFNVDLGLMQSQFAAIAAAQPLAFSPKLATAARQHSQDMFANVFQDHNGSDGSTPLSRITNSGFFGQAAENVFANAKSVAHGHAAFEVDWGGPASNGGMQSPPGHRVNIHNGVFREVGVGVVLGYNSTPGKAPPGGALDQVGPDVVTQDFGVANNSTPFITGVAYYDLNGNGFYDLGEGIGNVRVAVAGSNSEGLSARSGGYAVPVPTNATYTVTFSGPGFANLTQTVKIVGSKNQKLDFNPPYSPPVVTGPVVPTVGRSNGYSISTVGGAVAYEWRSFQKVPAASEGAENDSLHLTITQSAPYDVIEGIIVKSGSFAFHLVTPPAAARSQYITLTPAYLVNNNASLTFQSRLGFASPDQQAQIQLSTDEGANWVAVYSQAGDADHPETTWQQRIVDLSSYAGKAVRLRIAFEFTQGNYFDSTDLQVGWLIDDLQFSNVQQIVNEQISPPTPTNFSFQPALVGDFSLQARAQVGHDFLDWGPALSVHSAPASGTPELHLSVSLLGGGQLQLDITLANGAAPTTLTLESRSTLSTAWQSETATVQTIAPTQFRILTPVAGIGKTKFYRVRAG